MRFSQFGFYCVILSLALSVPAAAAEGAGPAQKSVTHLLLQENQLQVQIRDIHRELRHINRQIKQLDSQINATTKRLSDIEIRSEQIKQELAAQYGVLLVPILTVFQDQTPAANRYMYRERLQQFTAAKAKILEKRQQLVKQESVLRSSRKNVSDQIARTVRETAPAVSLEGINLEQLAALFAWPVTSTKEVSSDYGWREFNGDVEFHSGIDVAANEGDSIFASADGVVLYAGPAQGFGHWIVIRHPQGLLTIYGHMYRSGVRVKPGQTVKKGDLIGRVGADGQSFGPHLHFAVARGMTNGLPNTVDPWYFLDN
jgi:murein DD-endopeptidase MepM/ murein hydrolase activator NlpD